MSLNSAKIRTAITLKPNNAPTSPENGDIYYDQTQNVFFFYQNSGWVDYATLSAALTTNGVVVATGSGAIASTSAGTAGEILTSNGPSLPPTYQTLGTGSYTAPTVSAAYSSGIGTGGFTASASNYGYVFTISSASAVAGDVYQNSATVTITDATPGVMTTSVAHNLVPNTPVTFATTSALPSPLVAGTTYYVSVVPTATTFQVSLTPNGISINTTTAGSGTQTVLYGSFTIKSSTSSQISIVTTTPALIQDAGTVSFTGAPSVANTQPIVPPVSGTLAKVSGSGPATLTFSSSQFYNINFAGTLFTVTSANATAAAVYQDTKTCTITIAAPAVITTGSVAHGLIVGQPVTFSTTGALPTGLAINTTYYVSAVPTSLTFQVSTTQYGSSLTTTGTQSGVQTVNMASFTVASGATIAGYTNLFTTQATGYQPGASGTLTKVSGTGDSTITYSLGQPLATYTVPTSPRQPLYIEVEVVGGGGGGAASTGATAGSPGSSSTFGILLVSSAGGLGGYEITQATNYGSGGAPLWNFSPWTGSSTITPLTMLRGGNGSSGGGSTGNGFAAGNSLTMGGGPGGTNPLGGSGGGNIQGTFGSYCNAVPNTGAGGGGGSGGVSSAPAGQGGGAGAFTNFIIPQANLTSTYLYTVGLGGLGASSGGTGATGTIIIQEFYQ